MIVDSTKRDKIGGGAMPEMDAYASLYIQCSHQIILII
jgi:hypothetical protein